MDLPCRHSENMQGGRCACFCLGLTSLLNLSNHSSWGDGSLFGLDSTSAGSCLMLSLCRLSGCTTCAPAEALGSSCSSDLRMMLAYPDRECPMPYRAQTCQVCAFAWEHSRVLQASIHKHSRHHICSCRRPSLTSPDAVRILYVSLFLLQ